MIGRNSMEVCILAVLGVSSSFSATGHLPLSLAQVPVAGQAAGAALFFGCLLTLTGIFWREHDDSLLIQQGGYALLCFGTLFYATALFTSAFRAASLTHHGLGETILTTFTAAGLAIGYSVGIATGSGVRYFQIQRYVRQRKLDY